MRKNTQKLKLAHEFHMVTKMSSSEKQVLEQEPKKQTCFADYVVDVPEIIVNPKKFTNYKRLQFLGSVSVVFAFAYDGVACVLRVDIL